MFELVTFICPNRIMQHMEMFKLEILKMTLSPFKMKIVERERTRRDERRDERE